MFRKSKAEVKFDNKTLKEEYRGGGKT